MIEQFYTYDSVKTNHHDQQPEKPHSHMLSLNLIKCQKGCLTFNEVPWV